MKDVYFNSVVYQMKSPQAREMLGGEIVREVRRRGYILVYCKGFTPETKQFLNDEGIAVTEIKPHMFLVHDCSECVSFFIQNSPKSPEQIKEKHQKAFKEQFGDDSTVKLTVEVVDL
jgi:hypothetical protein